MLLISCDDTETDKNGETMENHSADCDYARRLLSECFRARKTAHE
jgi:hypothetical protein